MSLSPGTRLGHYDVTSLLGEGGMGQVWQATDTQLNRQVALKILPDAFASDPDRLARFTREAQILASLNHPGIAAIYGIEETEGTRALVLELVEGPTLADRIAQGAMPLDDALPIARQIAEALEAAHEAGVIHRDLKPANIKVRKDGTVKVLDFGLAKALEPAPEADPSQSPTLTAAATQMGVILGTAAYMSPEQARGKPVDRRADIWAFGVVLFEMVTGRRPFQGRDVSEVLGGVLRLEPEWNALPGDTPPRVSTLLRRCLEKEPKQRLQAVGDIRLAMEGAFETAAPAGPVAALQLWQRPVPAAMFVLVIAALTSLAVWALTRATPATGVVRFTFVPEADSFGSQSNDRDLTISPDGAHIVYRGAAETGFGSQLYVRPIDDFDATPLRGAEGGAAPFVSPDGQWVGFISESRRALQKVSILGGTPVPLTDQSTTPLSGATWGGDNLIFYAAQAEGLYRVSADGGEPEALTTPDVSRGDIGGRPRSRVWTLCCL